MAFSKPATQSRCSAKLKEDDDIIEIFGCLLPGLIESNAILRNLCKRRRSEGKTTAANARKRDGRIGRTWQQRKKHDNSAKKTHSSQKISVGGKLSTNQTLEM